MDFKLVTSSILKELDSQQISYAVIGGFALGFWGVTRTTIDMDLLLLADDDAKVERILSQYSYRTVHKSENVAQYVSDLAQYGSIDVIYAFRDISRSMLERSVASEMLPGLTIQVLIPEDIIGLKLQALVNDPKREARDNADIDALLNAKVTRGEQIDWELLQDYYELFERSSAFRSLREKYDKTQ